MRRFLAFVVLSVLTACGSSTPTDGNTPPPPPAATPASVVVTAGDGQQAEPGTAVALNPSVSHHLNSVIRARVVDALRASALATSDKEERNRTIQLLLAFLDGEPLTGFTHLASLDLSGVWLGRVQMQSLRVLHGLRELDLSGTLLLRGTLEFLASLPALRRLSLRGTDVWTSDMEYVSQLPALESLPESLRRHVH